MTACGGICALLETRERPGRSATWAAAPEHLSEPPLVPVKIFEKMTGEQLGRKRFAASDRACNGKRHGRVVGRLARRARIQERAVKRRPILAYDGLAKAVPDRAAVDELERRTEGVADSGAVQAASDAICARHAASEVSSLVSSSRKVSSPETMRNTFAYCSSAAQ
jgi:hypothetical protein